MLHDRPISPRTFVVVATRYVVPPTRAAEQPFTEIVIGSSQDPDALRTIVITRDDALAQRAIALEGTDARVTAVFRPEPCRRGFRQVLEALA